MCFTRLCVTRHLYADKRLKKSPTAQIRLIMDWDKLSPTRIRLRKCPNRYTGPEVSCIREINAVPDSAVCCWPWRRKAHFAGSELPSELPTSSSVRLGSNFFVNKVEADLNNDERRTLGAPPMVANVGLLRVLLLLLTADNYRICKRQSATLLVTGRKERRIQANWADDDDDDRLGFCTR